MKKILFVLRDEDLYQVWIEIAERLKFESMNDTGSKATVASKQSPAQPPKAARSDDVDRDQPVAKGGATPPSKESKSSGEQDDRHASHGKADGRKTDSAHRKSIIISVESKDPEGTANQPGDDASGTGQEKENSKR